MVAIGTVLVPAIDGCCCSITTACQGLCNIFGCNCETECYNGYCGYCIQCVVFSKYGEELNDHNLECCNKCYKYYPSRSNYKRELSPINFAPVSAWEKFTKIDLDQNGFIDGNETMIMLAGNDIVKDMYEVTKLLREMDENDNGLIERGEFDESLK